MYFFYFHIQKCLQIHHLNIIKKQKRALKNGRERYKHLTTEEKEKKRQYGRKQCKNLSEDEKQKLV